MFVCVGVFAAPGAATHGRPLLPSNSVSDLSQEHSMANDTTTFFTINKIVLLVDLRNQITLVSLS